MKRVSPIAKAHLIRGAVCVLLLLAVCVAPFARGQRNATNSGVVGPNISSLAGAVSSTSGAAEAQRSISPAPESTPIVLWDQYNSVGTGDTLSAAFTDFPGYDADLADDFVVPAGFTWLVEWIDVGNIIVLPTPTATPTPSARPTPTPRPSATPRPRPTPPSHP